MKKNILFVKNLLLLFFIYLLFSNVQRIFYLFFISVSRECIVIGKNSILQFRRYIRFFIPESTKFVAFVLFLNIVYLYINQHLFHTNCLTGFVQKFGSKMFFDSYEVFSSCYKIWEYLK